MNDSPNRDVQVFTEALALPRAERASLLDRACGGDSELRRSVEALLKAHESVGDFLETSPQTLFPKGRAGVLVGEMPGDRIGRYKLLQQIGEGGCGVVFMAEQEEPVSRRVALKIIKPGMDTKSVIARFEAERQALALMDHPNIAKIFDAGATESCRPYFVMELVRGINITEYCDQRSLTTQERLKLFVQVCQAIQHAHQKGIIHRDIKPSNILVTQTEQGDTLPVIIDFGIAKATTNQQLTDKTLFTAFEMLIGTPAYMSPEQAALTSVDVDTRTDIYSLGVLLYELLTGSTPFDTGELLKSGLDEIRRVIREQEPVRPSTRLSKLAQADLTSVAQHRHSEPPTLIRTVHGDLDWIVMKALEKDRMRRYATAQGLSLDVLRFLTNEAVSARPPSKLYRFRKVVQRNKLVFATVGIIALLVVASLIIVSASLANERRSRRAADAASVKSQEVTKFLEDALQGVGPSVALGQDTKMLRGIMDRTVERIGYEMTNQPAVDAELRNVIGTVYRQLGDYGRAEEMHRAAVEIRRKLFGTNDARVAESLNELGLELQAENKLPDAERAMAEALAIRRRLFGSENVDTARSMNDLSAVLRDEGRLIEAEALAREALGIRQSLLGNENLDVADSLRNLSLNFGAQDKWAESEAMAREVLVMRRKLLGPDHPWIASALNDVAWTMGGQGKFREAEKLQREALAIRRKLLPEDHPDVAVSLQSIGDSMRQQGNLPEAYSVLSAALSIQRKVLGEDDPSSIETMNRVGLTLAAEGKWSEAETVHSNVLVLWRKRAGNESQHVLFTMTDLGLALENEHKWPEAEALYHESLTLSCKILGNEDPHTLYVRRKLGLVLEAEHKWPETETVFRESLDLARKRGKENPEALVDLERLVRALMPQKKFGEAEQLLDEMLTPAFVSQPASVNLLTERVDIKGRQGRWQEAAGDVALLLQLQPSEQYHYHRMAALLAISQNRPVYEQLCRKIAATFTNTANPYVDERVAQDCLLLPDSGVDLQWVDKLADAAVMRGNGEASLPYFQGCKAMSDYRLGHFREAVEWADKATKSTTAEPLAKAKAYAVLALANWQLGQKEAARAALVNGDRLAQGISPEDDAVDLGESWVAWIMARVSLDEATELPRIESTNHVNSN